MSDTFQIIGGYDRRRSTSTIAARDAHAMVRESNKRAGITKPRAQKSRSLKRTQKWLTLLHQSVNTVPLSCLDISHPFA